MDALKEMLKIERAIKKMRQREQFRKLNATKKYPDLMKSAYPTAYVRAEKRYPKIK